MKELTPFEDAFLTEYQNNGFIGSKAYLALKPNVAETSAQALSCRLLAEPYIKEALKERTRAKQESVNKSTLVQDARRIMLKAESKAQYSAALKGVDVQAQLTGAYSQDEDDASKYKAFMVQVNIKQGQVNNHDNQSQMVEVNTHNKQIKVDDPMMIDHDDQS